MSSNLRGYVDPAIVAVGDREKRLLQAVVQHGFTLRRLGTGRGVRLTGPQGTDLCLSSLDHLKVADLVKRGAADGYR